MSAPLVSEDGTITLPGQTPAAAAPDAGSPKPPPWGSPDEFNPEIAWERIQKQAADIAKFKQAAKTPDEERALREHAALVAASKSAEERALEAQTAAEARATAANMRVARAEVKAALAGVVENPDAIVDDLNLAKFVGDDGEVDAAAVKALRDKYAGFGSPRAPRPDASQGSGANGVAAAGPAEEFASFIRAQIGR
jgi:hypothetical protein